jgi:hypothetical protein
MNIILEWDESRGPKSLIGFIKTFIDDVYKTAIGAKAFIGGSRSSISPLPALESSTAGLPELG